MTSAGDDGVVLVVDDDDSVRGSIAELLRSIGVKTEGFASAQAFLLRPRPETAACVVLDVQLPGLSGFDLQAELARSEPPLPIVFLTGHGSIPMSVRAMKRGAIEFLTKPFDPDALIDAVRQGLDQDRKARERQANAATIRARWAKLTPREREVMGLVVAGLLNKQIANRLGTSEQTIKVHRGRVMRKLEAGSVAELVKLAQRLGVEPK